MARQDSWHRSPENGRNAECTYSSEIGTVKIDRPCYQNAWWTFATENPLWRTTSWKKAPMVVRRSDTRTPTRPPLKPTYQQSRGNDCTGRGLMRRGAGEYEAKRIGEAEQKRAQRKARAKASPTELSSSDLSCSICNRQDWSHQPS